MRRRLFTFLAALSLLLCVATCVLWVRSYDHLTAVVPAITSERLYGVSAVRGGLYIGTTAAPAEGGSQQRFLNVPIGPDFLLVDVEYLGLGFGYVNDSTGYAAVRLPFWFVAALALLPLAFVCLRRLRRQQRLNHGLCLTCGYDMRGTPHRCPECGAVRVLKAHWTSGLSHQVLGSPVLGSLSSVCIAPCELAEAPSPAQEKVPRGPLPRLRL